MWPRRPWNTETVWRRKIPITLACLLGLALNGYLWRPFLPYFFARANNDFACTRRRCVVAWPVKRSAPALRNSNREMQRAAAKST